MTTTTPMPGDPVEVVPAVVDITDLSYGPGPAADQIGVVPRAAAAASMPTQMRKPWRATVRTIVAGFIGFAPLAPAVYQAATHHDPAAATGLAGISLAICGGVTRGLALPAVETFLRRYKALRWLAAASGRS